MSYQQKYLKYKKKYIDLKNQLGAAEITAGAAAEATAVAEKEVAEDLLGEIKELIEEKNKIKIITDKCNFNQEILNDITKKINDYNMKKQK